MIVNSVNSVLNNSVMQKITQMACQLSLIATIWYKLLKQFGNNTASGRVTLLVHYVTKGAFGPKKNRPGDEKVFPIDNALQNKIGLYRNCGYYLFVKLRHGSQ